MSTRSVITFKVADNTFHVYKHMDGYPDGILPDIEEAKKFAWELPRFDPADFAAAFIRATKETGGNVYFTQGPDYHGDLEYRYIVEFWGDELRVDVWTNHLSESDYKTLEHFHKMQKPKTKPKKRG